MAYEYALVDKDGRLREDFDRKSDAIEELIRIEGKHPGATGTWMLLTYDDAGRQVCDPEWAGDLLAKATSPETVILGEGVARSAAAQPAGKSGSGTSTRHGFRRPLSAAKGTRVLSEAETVGG